MEEQALGMLQQGAQVTVQVLGGMARKAEQMIAALKAMLTKERTAGKSTVKDMLKSGEQLEFVQIPNERLAEFNKLAKSYNLSAPAEKGENAATVVFKSRDLSKFNQVMEKMNMGERGSQQDAGRDGSTVERTTFKGDVKENVKDKLAIKQAEIEAKKVERTAEKAARAAKRAASKGVGR